MGNCCRGKKTGVSRGNGRSSAWEAEVITPRFHPQVSPRTMDPVPRPSLPAVSTPPPVPLEESVPSPVVEVPLAVKKVSPVASSKGSDDEAEAATAPFRPPRQWEPHTSVPKLNLDFIAVRPKVMLSGEPSIICSQPFSGDKEQSYNVILTVAEPKKEGSSLSVSSSSGLAPSGLSKDGQSALGMSAIGFSSEANSGFAKDLSGVSKFLHTDGSAQSSSSLMLRPRTSRNTSTLEYSSSVPKEPLSLILERSASSLVFDYEDDVDHIINCPENPEMVLKLSDAARVESKSSEASTQKFTFRPPTGRARRTTTLR